VIDVLYVMKELLRCKKIWVGVGVAGKLYGSKGDSFGHLMHAVVLGTVASCGTGFMINLGHSISMRPYNGRILLSTSVFTKISVVLSALYCVYPGYKSYLVLAQCVYMISYKLHILHTEVFTTAFQGCGWLITDALSGFQQVEESDQVEQKQSEKPAKKSKKSSKQD
jgi:hypothetical protein